MEKQHNASTRNAAAAAATKSVDGNRIFDNSINSSQQHQCRNRAEAETVANGAAGSLA